ncbi:hypothetical protein GH714_031011 [Hevea brasiliensis]|uniref:Retrotransposon gag domain-containing protein n=1 Tax=Hevea brasiliensis TaxID=3981 RepID=A0A6A6NDD1_HEVBR|nr:hypothetical protein GH714_031011 [Hevea brasiliensis]
MATNKERIENLEVGLGQLQEDLSKMERGLSDELQQIKAAITKFSELSLTSKDASSSISNRISQNLTNQEESRDGGRPLVSAKLAKLEFPKYSGDDPTEWFTRVDQFFEYQGTPDSEKVSLASYHLRGEANEWWQWLRRTHTKQGRQVKGWTQKALVGTFMGGLKPEIAEGIRMFKPKTLKEAISLARMRDEQLLRQKKAIRPSYQTSFLSPTTSKPSTPIKRLSWEEMQNRRAKGLCFNCDEKFVPGHRCTKPQLLLLDGGFDIDDDDEDGEPEISLHALTGWSSSGTMRVVIQIKSLELICLIDSGSTHNFINEKVAGSLKLLVEPTRPFNVKVANGDPLQCSGKFRNTPALLQVAAAIGDSPMQLGQVDYGFYLEWGAATPARGTFSYHEVDQTLQTRDEILRELKSHLSRAANQMKQYVDLKCRDVEFQVGDHVYLKLQPYRQQSVSKRLLQNLQVVILGPIECWNVLENWLINWSSLLVSKVHPVFHVSLLKQHIVTLFLSLMFCPYCRMMVKPFWNQQQYWIQGGFVEGLEPFKKVWFYGNICHRKMLPGKIQLNYRSDFRI